MRNKRLTIPASDFVASSMDDKETPVRSVTGRMFGVRVTPSGLSMRDCGMSCDATIDQSQKLGFVVTETGAAPLYILEAPTHVEQVAAILRAIGLPVIHTRECEHVWPGEVQITPAVRVVVNLYGRQHVAERQGKFVRVFEERDRITDVFADLRDALGIAPEAALRLPG